MKLLLIAGASGQQFLVAQHAADSDSDSDGYVIAEFQGMSWPIARQTVDELNVGR